MHLSTSTGALSARNQAAEKLFFWVTFLGECSTNSVVDNKDKSVEVLQFHGATACLRLGECGSDLRSVEAFPGTLCPFEVLL